MPFPGGIPYLHLLTLMITALLALALAAPISALIPTVQEPESVDPIAQALTEWNEAQGGDWLLRRNSDHPSGRYLFGLQAPALFTPHSDREFFELGLMFVEQTEGMFGIDIGTLVADEVVDIALSQIGGTDKVAVSYTQWVRGIPVDGASLHIIFTPQGDLLGLDSKALAGVEDITLTSRVDPYAAVGAAKNDFYQLEGVEAAFVGQPELLILRHAEGKWARPRLAWAIELRNETLVTDPHGRTMFVAADNASMEILEARQLIHHEQQISGNVDSYATPGTAANMASNPPAIMPMRFMNLTSPAGNTTTDANGDFTLASANATDITARYNGPWANVQNQSGANHFLTQNFVPGTPGTMLMNPTATELRTAEASCFDAVVEMHEWLESIDPADSHLDFPVLANANLPQNCNAYYNGFSINMYTSGGGCNNTGFSTIVAHEEGHWANSLYGSGNGSDGFGEGNADVFSMYVYDTPVVGLGFSSSSSGIRTGLNNRQFCGNSNPGCYGQVHADGEVLMGALWKVRANLNTTYGNAPGDLVADTLFVAWMNAYNDGQIRTFIEDHWLTLDDTNGNIYDGTPNFGDIDGGFRAQGFPGVQLQLLDIVHTPLGDTQNEQGPYLVSADVTSLIGAAVTSVEMTWSVDGGATTTLPMINTSADTWEAPIPGQISPTTVSYHMEATDSAGNTLLEPLAGAHSFVVGIRTSIYFNDFEGATDEGWTHQQVATQDDWQRGTPQGKAEDPVGAFSGTKCWANDLGLSGWNGIYQPNVHNVLNAPVIDCTGRTGVTLRFQRWLAVEKGIYDNAEILVNGSLVWANASGSDHVDSAWQEMEVDISQWADNNASVQVQFRLRSDGGLQRGGWNIDDYEVFVLEPVNPNANQLLLGGSTSAAPGAQVSWSIAGMDPNSAYWLVQSSSNAGTTFQGHQFNVGTPYSVISSGSATIIGSAFVTATVPAGAGGTTVYLEAASRNGGIWKDSNPLTFTVQ